MHTDPATSCAQETRRRCVLRILAVAAGIALGALAVLSIVCSFVAHMTPDISIYLLHARTFVETGNRFALSWENKGLLLTLLLAPGVGLFGPTVIAAAAVQFAAHAAAFICLYRLLSPRAAKATALFVVMIGIAVVSSPFLWGAKARPEDFALPFCVLVLAAALCATPRGWITGGVMTVACLLLKITLVLAPAAVLLAASVADASAQTASAPERRVIRFARSLLRNLAWTALGFLLAAGAAFAWIALADDLSQCVRQTITWPLEYRGGNPLTFAALRNTLRLLRTCRLGLPLIGCVAGFVVGWRSGFRREALLAAVFLSAEILRITLEGAPYPYLATPAVLPMLIGITLLGGVERPRPAVAWGWIIPLGLAMPLLLPSCLRQIRTLDMRLVKKLPSPYERMADMLRARYQPGETVFIVSNQEEIILRLDAPAPAPILNLHFPRVSPEEQRYTQEHYAAAPPDWIITRDASPASVPCTILGEVDDVVFAWLPASSETPPSAGVSTRPGRDLTPVVARSRPYRLEADLGYLQAWRLAED